MIQIIYRQCKLQLARPPLHKRKLAKAIRILPLVLASNPNIPNTTPSLAHTNPHIPLRVRRKHMRVEPTNRHRLTAPVQPRRREINILELDEPPIRQRREIMVRR